MPALSTHYAIVTLPNGDQISPISVDVTLDEAWSPYCQATVVLPSNLITDDINPRLGSRLGLRLQQDFGDLIYNYELTAAYGGSVAAITAQYSELLATNYIKNPTFNTGTTDWDASTVTTTISRDTTEYYSSPASLKVVTTLAGGGTNKLNTAIAGLTAGQKFSGSAWVKATAGTPLRFGVSSQGTGAVQANNFFTATGAWQYVKAENATLGTSLNPYVFVLSTAGAGVTFYVDNVILNSGATVTDYFDGNTTDTPEITYAWTGTADNSASIKYDPVRPVEITRDFTKPWNIFETALPLSTVTTAYGGDVSNITAAGLIEVWRMSDFLHSAGTFNPLPSTIFAADLGVRSIAYDYVTKEATIQLTSDEALTQDVHGYGDDIMVEYDDARTLINEVLNFISASLEPGTANYTYSPAYQLQKYEFNLPSTAWDFLETITAAAGLKLYCDEQRNWYLVDPTAIAGTLVLDDTDNITSFTKEISRDGLWYNQAVIQYDTISDGVIWDNYYASGTGPIKTLFMKKENIEFPGMGAAQSMVERSLTRGEIYSIEAVSNFDARPRQTLTVDITGEPVKTGIVQSISWSLPSARMSVDIRDLQEVI